LNVSVQLGFGYANYAQQLLEERIGPGDGFSPIVLPTLISEKLTPLEDANVQKVSIRICPEVASKDSLFPFPPRPVKGQIAEAMAAQNRHSTEILSTCHFAT
jgi:hypothetical protein